MSDDLLDCIVIGAGPASLTAAIYLARYRWRFVVMDGGDSRASWIPVSHNLAGFPEGITGPDVLARMAEQARRYGAGIEAGRVEALTRAPDGTFEARLGGRSLRARTVLLATEVVDLHPDLPDLRGAVRQGLVRYCGICDGYEVRGRRLGVLGRGRDGPGEALFLRAYASDITLMALGASLSFGAGQRQKLEQAGIAILASPVSALAVEPGRVAVTTGSGRMLRFDHLYVELGDAVRSELAGGLGAELGSEGCVVTDQHQHTAVDGLFAAGDVTLGLDQISVAMGHAAMAATAIHNRLRA